MGRGIQHSQNNEILVSSHFCTASRFFEISILEIVALEAVLA